MKLEESLSALVRVQVQTRMSSPLTHVRVLDQHARVFARVGDQVGDLVYAQVRAQVGGRVRDRVEQRIEENVS